MLCRYAALRQRDLDPILPPRAQTQHLPPVLPQKGFWVSRLAQAGVPSMFALLSQRRLGWISYVTRMEAGRFPKDILYVELATGTRCADVSKMQFVNEKDSGTENYPPPRPPH